MGKILKTIKHEFLEVIPPTIFFLVGFSLLIVTKTLILKDYGIHFSGYAKAVVGALMVGKILLIVDKFSFVNKFPDKPLMYNVVWKTMIYFLAAFIFRYGEHLFHFLSKYGNFIEANRQLWEEINWPHFWLIQMWLSVLLFVYCAFREYVRAVGSEEIVHMFLGWRRKTEKASSLN
jgi:hypothetical protein